MPSNLDGILTAELGHSAAFDQYEARIEQGQASKAVALTPKDVY